MASLAIRHVSHRFGATSVLEHVSLEVAEGEFLVSLQANARARCA